MSKKRTLYMGIIIHSYTVRFYFLVTIIIITMNVCNKFNNDDCAMTIIIEDSAIQQDE